MDFLKNITAVIKEAAGAVAEQNHRTAQANRIRGLIKLESQAAEQEYLALGRYYYNQLRDAENPVTESHCAAIDALEERIAAGQSRLEQLFFTGEDPEEIGEIDAFDEDFEEDFEETEPEELTEAEQELVDLEDVEVYDHDPMGGEEDENSTLPFEG